MRYSIICKTDNLVNHFSRIGISTEQQKKTWLINWYFENEPTSSIYLATLRNPALVASYQTSPGMLYGTPFATGMENYFQKIKAQFGQSMFDQLLTEFAQQSNLYVDEIKVDEWHIYGSSRLGLYEANRTISKRVARDLNNDNQITNNEYLIETPEEVMFLYSSYQLERGAKRYELANHLGNVLTAISDKKTANFTGSTFTNFTAERISATDYSPFGAPLAGRTWNGGEYRFGFNGQERDDEVAGVGNITTAEFWEYDARLGRRWNVDPKVNPSIGSYVCFANNPLIYSDPYGDTLFSIGSSTQNLKDLRGMVNPNLRSRITISQIANRNDGMGDYVSINSAGYVAGTDAGMDLLISLSGNSINSAYSTADLPIGERAGPNREASSTSVPILVPYDESGVTVFTLTPKESLLGNTSKFRNGNFPPSKNVTGPGAMPGQIVVVPITLDFLVAINPNISRFTGTNGRKEIPRSMVAFQQLQTALLFTNNSRTNINSTFDQAYRATNFMLRSALLVGGNYNGERLVRYPLVPDVTKLRN